MKKCHSLYVFIVLTHLIPYIMNNYPNISKNNLCQGFLPNIKVIMENFMVKPISEIKAGDKIYVDSSTTDQVQNVRKFIYSGPIKEIRCKGQFFKIKSLEKQLFFAIKKEIRDYCRKKYSKIKLRVLEENIEILKSRQLKNGDMLLIPKHKTIKNNFKLKTKDFITTFSNYIRNKIPEILNYTKDLFRWFGYYLAEGMILFTSDKRYEKKCRGVSFTISINEKSLLKEIICSGEEIFGVKPKVIEILKRNAYRINFYNTQLGELINCLFNTGSSKKEYILF